MKKLNGVQEPLTVVVAEDSPMQALNLKELLTQVGLRVLWAQNGVECLKLIDQTQPGLILLDLEMPEMNGLQTCEVLKSRPDTANIPIIIFTRHDDPEFARLGFQTGAVDYIPKDAFANAVLLETLVQLGIISAEARANGNEINER
jgi:CheY-like chemotaxis protein